MMNNINKISKLIDEDNDELEFDKLSSLLNNVSDSEKNNFIKNIERSKELLLLEIDRNKQLREIKRNKQISYILKHSNSIDLSSIIVDMLEDKELQILYDKVVYENRSIFKKIIEFLFYSK